MGKRKKYLFTAKGMQHHNDDMVYMMFIHDKGRRNTMTKDRTDRVHTT